MRRSKTTIAVSVMTGLITCLTNLNADSKIPNFWDVIPVSPSTIATKEIKDDYWHGQFQWVNKLNHLITENAKRLSTEQSTIALADQNTGFDISTDLESGSILPSAKGAKKMAVVFALSINEALTKSKKFGLAVSEYAPGGQDPISFNWPTHIAFGPGDKEVLTDLKNNRFLYRDSSEERFKVSPISVKGQHSVIYNPADKLYYANDTANNRLISFADLSKAKITAETDKILGITLNRPHDVVIDPATNWIYALNPNSGHVFRFTAIGKDESVFNLGKHLGGYARSLTFVNGHLYVIGSAQGRIVEILDWDKEQVKVYKSFKKIRSAAAGSWTTTGLVLNDAEYFDGFWYASSYFTPSYAKGTDHNENKLIRFKTLDDFASGKWEDISSLVPDKMTPYYLTLKGDSLYLAIFAHKNDGEKDMILKFTTLKK